LWEIGGTVTWLGHMRQHGGAQASCFFCIFQKHDAIRPARNRRTEQHGIHRAGERAEFSRQGCALERFARGIIVCCRCFAAQHLVDSRFGKGADISMAGHLTSHYFGMSIKDPGCRQETPKFRHDKLSLAHNSQYVVHVGWVAKVHVRVTRKPHAASL